MSSYCPSSLACQTCDWKKLLVALHTIWARLFSRPMMWSLLWSHFPWQVAGVPPWERMGQHEGSWQHPCLSIPQTWEENKLWDDPSYGSQYFVLQWWNQTAKQLLYFQGRGNLAQFGFVLSDYFILCLCTSCNQIGMLVQNQPSRKTLIFLPIPLYLSPGFTKVVRCFFFIFLWLGPALLSL